MIATPRSRRPYFPALLANGADAVLLNYSGSMASGLTGHAHLEQHQGCPCAWYKIAHVAENPTCKVVQPIVQSGYQVMLDGEVCDIDDYAQRFDPVHAVLHTRTSARGVRVSIEAFLTDDHILVERYHVEAVPAGKKADLAFFAAPRTGARADSPPCMRASCACAAGRSTVLRSITASGPCAGPAACCPTDRRTRLTTPGRGCCSAACGAGSGRPSFSC